jgi:hypothetical protein
MHVTRVHFESVKRLELVVTALLALIQHVVSLEDFHGSVGFPAAANQKERVLVSGSEAREMAE